MELRFEHDSLHNWTTKLGQKDVLL
jgi:hypothetical protein